MTDAKQQAIDKRIEYKRQYQLALAWVLDAEGGYANDPDDPGKATNRGITQRSLNAARRSAGAEALLPEHVKDLTLEQTASIYESDYWEPSTDPEFPLSLNLVLFDHAVNGRGAAAAVKVLQKVLRSGLATDGMIGPLTRGATARALARDKTRLLASLLACRIERIARGTGHPKFFFGLFRRIISMSMLLGTSVDEQRLRGILQHMEREVLRREGLEG